MSLIMRLVIICLFVLSGVTSLVYETLWIRVLSLGIGSTSASMSIVLSVFFFGLSVGSFFAGKYIEKIKNPLRVYGYIEGLIGVYALALIYLLLNFSEFLHVLPLASIPSWLIFFSKSTFVFILLLPPTVCMGATLPILVKVLSVQKSGVGKNVAFLYTINTLGAVLGAFGTGYFFIPQFGVLTSNHIMVVLNVAIFLVCFLVSKKLLIKGATSEASGPVSSNEKHNSSVSESVDSEVHGKKVIFLACGLIGFSSIGAEVVWSKYLGIFFGTNIFGLSLILSTFLLGIASGSYVLSLFIDQVKNKKSLFFWLMAFTIAAISVASQLLSFAPILANISSYYLNISNFLVIKSVIAALILFLPTCLFGALLPLAINLLTQSHEKAAEYTGQAYAINTWGGILGSALVGLLLIPKLGSGKSLQLLCLVLVASLFVTGWSLLKESRLKKVLPATIVLLFAILFSPSINFKNIIKSAEYSAIDQNFSLERAVSYFADGFEDIIFIHEGKTAITSLNYEMYEGKPVKSQYRLRTNGLNESFYDLDNLQQLPKFEGLLAMLPYAFHKDPKKAFVVGYGGGFTVNMLTSLDLDLVHVAELEEGILKAADFVHKGENPVLKRKNLDLQIEDARFVLNARLKGPYDIIVSQPSHSWLSGVANLFTKEFFETVKRNLASGGIYAQWLNLYNMDVVSLRSIIRTYYSVFPEGALFTDLREGELILLGSNQPLAVNLDRLKKLTQRAELQEKLKELPFSTPYELLSNYSMSRDTILKITDGVSLNTDVNAFAEVRQSSMFYSPESQEELAQPYLSRHFDGRTAELLSSFQQLNENEKAQFNLKMMTTLSRLQKYDKLFRMMSNQEKIEGNAPGRLASFHRDRGDLCYAVERYACAVEHYKKSYIEKPEIYTARLVATSLIAAKKYEEALKWIGERPSSQSISYECEFYDAKARSGEKIDFSTLTVFTENLGQKIDFCGSQMYRTVGQNYLLNGETQTAIRFFESRYQLNPDDILNLRLLTSAYLQEGQNERALEFAGYLDSVLQIENERLESLSGFFSDYGWEADAKVLKEIQESLM